MPATKTQKMFFMFMTVLFSVTAFVIYNIALSTGTMSNRVFLMALKEIPVEFIIAFALEVSFAGLLAEKMAFRIVNPERDRPVLVILAITCMTICIMCPSMSFIATVLYNGLNMEFVSNWLQKIVFNFPFAFFIQIFVIGPLVRLIFRSVFRKQMDADNRSAF